LKVGLTKQHVLINQHSHIGSDHKLLYGGTWSCCALLGSF